MIERTPGTSSGPAEEAVLSVSAVTVEGAAPAALSDAGGVASPDVPGGGLGPAGAPLPFGSGGGFGGVVAAGFAGAPGAIAPGAAVGAAPAVDIAENDRQAVLARADDHDLGVGRLRQHQRRLDAAPAQIGFRNPLADRFLERGDAVRLDLFALGFLGFTLTRNLYSWIM